MTDILSQTVNCLVKNVPNVYIWWPVSASLLPIRLTPYSNSSDWKELWCGHYPRHNFLKKLWRGFLVTPQRLSVRWIERRRETDWKKTGTYGPPYTDESAKSFANTDSRRYLFWTKLCSQRPCSQSYNRTGTRPMHISAQAHFVSAVIWWEHRTCSASSVNTYNLWTWCYASQNVLATASWGADQAAAAYIQRFSQFRDGRRLGSPMDWLGRDFFHFWWVELGRICQKCRVCTQMKQQSQTIIENIYILIPLHHTDLFWDITGNGSALILLCCFYIAEIGLCPWIGCKLPSLRVRLGYVQSKIWLFDGFAGSHRAVNGLGWGPKKMDPYPCLPQLPLRHAIHHNRRLMSGMRMEPLLLFPSMYLTAKKEACFGITLS